MLHNQSYQTQPILQDFLNTTDVLSLKKNLQLATAVFMLSEERKLLEDELVFLIEMQSLIKFLDDIETEI